MFKSRRRFTYNAERLEKRLLLSSVTFQPADTYATGYSPNSVAAADLGNGFVDIVVVNESGSAIPSPGTVSIFIGDGYGGFQLQYTYAVGSVPDSVAVADFG